MTNEMVCESRPFVRSWDECVMCARDWSGGGDGWDLEALAGVLYEGARFLPGEVRWYERATVDEEAARACDYRGWRPAMACDRRRGMVAERWDTDARGRVYNVSLWDEGGAASLLLSMVSEWGASPWAWASQTVGDSEHPATWGELDRVFGGRDVWERELSEAAARFIGG